MRKSYKILLEERDTYIVLVVVDYSIVVNINIICLLLAEEIVIVVRIVKFLIKLLRYSKISHTLVMIQISLL